MLHFANSFFRLPALLLSFLAVHCGSCADSADAAKFKTADSGNCQSMEVVQKYSPSLPNSHSHVSMSENNAVFSTRLPPTSTHAKSKKSEKSESDFLSVDVRAHVSFCVQSNELRCAKILQSRSNVFENLFFYFILVPDRLEFLSHVVKGSGLKMGRSQTDEGVKKQRQK
jgi:hypothetical protein